MEENQNIVPGADIPETTEQSNNLVFYDAKDVAKFLNCSVPIARGIMHRKDFPLLMIGRKMLVMKQALETWAMERRT